MVFHTNKIRHLKWIRSDPPSLCGGRCGGVCVQRMRAAPRPQLKPAKSPQKNVVRRPLVLFCSPVRCCRHRGTLLLSSRERPRCKRASRRPTKATKKVRHVIACCAAAPPRPPKKPFFFPRRNQAGPYIHTQGRTSGLLVQGSVSGIDQSKGVSGFGVEMKRSNRIESSFDRSSGLL